MWLDNRVLGTKILQDLDKTAHVNGDKLDKKNNVTDAKKNCKTQLSSLFFSDVLNCS